MKRIQNSFKVVSNQNICPEFRKLRIDAKPILKNIRPGQFVHIRVSNGLKPFFRRPFSACRAKKYLEIFYEVVGNGTRILASKNKGDSLDVLGPLGTPFSMPPKGTRQIVLIAGGIGLAPMLILSDALAAKKCELILLYGGRTGGHVYSMREFKENGCKVLIATEDGSAGIKGRVSALFSEIDPDPATTFIYTCGPRPMMAVVQDFARRHGLKGEASCEEVMACGTGICLGCAIETTKGFKTVCNDGPVFDLDEVIFDQ